MVEIYKNRKNFLAAFIISILFTVLLVFVELLVYESAVVENNSFCYVRGYYGLKKRATYVHSRSEGIITSEKLLHYLNIYKNISSNEATLIGEQEYPEYGLLLQKAYAPIGEEFTYDIAKIDDVSDFDQRHEIQVNSYLFAGNEPELSNNEVKYAVEQANKSCTNIEFDFTDHFYIFERTFSFISVVIVICTIILTVIIFTQDRESKMDLILCAVNKKQLKKVGFIKYLTSLTITYALFAVVVLFIFLIILLPIGDKGWNTAIQCDLDYYRSILTWNNNEFVWFMILGGLCALCAIVSFTSIVALVTRNKMLSILLVIATIYLPILIFNGVKLPLIKHILSVLPINNMFPDRYLRSFFSYGFGTARIHQFYFTLILSMVITIILGYVNCKIFYRRMKE